MEFFQQIIGIQKIAETTQMSAEDLQKGLRAALEEDGYSSPEHIVSLVRQVKQEIAEENGQK